ncbi:MAG: MarR family transcriptional regulator [Methylobacteriaceae bacterium]|nr:MarR family transcriptional regulator [Methylobacteriaceae bacterium]
MTRAAARAVRPEAEEQGLVLARFLPYRLNVAAVAISQDLARLYGARWNIGIAEWRLIATLGETDGLTATQLVADTRLHKTKVSRAVATLESRGLLRREADSADRRSARLSLTGAGRALYAEVAPVALDHERRLRARIEPADLAAFERVLDRLIALGREVGPS